MNNSMGLNEGTDVHAEVVRNNKKDVIPSVNLTASFRVKHLHVNDRCSSLFLLLVVLLLPATFRCLTGLMPVSPAANFCGRNG